MLPCIKETEVNSENIETNSPPYDPFMNEGEINSNNQPYVPSETPPPIELGPRTPSISPLPSIEFVQPPSSQIPQPNTILQVEEPPNVNVNEEKKQEGGSQSETGEKKVIITDLGNSNSESQNEQSETKKIIL